MNILICPNAFKGSLTAMEAATAIDSGLRRAGGNTPKTTLIPLADGGDGTLQTLVDSTNGTVQYALARDPLGRLRRVAWGRLGGGQCDTAVIEMALTSGLVLLTPEECNPLFTSTLGTGDLIKAAVDAGCTRIILGIGGSATNDGGAGMVQALGARLLDSTGYDLAAGAATLATLHEIDLCDWSLPESISIQVACDVDNPLCGDNGASAIYGPQKGATPDMVQKLDAALAHFADILKSQLGKDVVNIPGAGAAGGLGAGLMAFCGAELSPGIELMLDATGFDEKLDTVDLVITGEGRLDSQTAHGKVIAGVARRAKLAGKPVIALCGSIEPGADRALENIGLTSSYSIMPQGMPLVEAMAGAAKLLELAACRLWEDHLL